MAYTEKNFRTKKALKDAVKAYNDYRALPESERAKLAGAESSSAGAFHPIIPFRPPLPVTVFQPGGMFPCPTEGRVTLEGPHYPAPHTWYATGVLKDGILISVK